MTIYTLPVIVIATDRIEKAMDGITDLCEISLSIRHVPAEVIWINIEPDNHITAIAILGVDLIRVIKRKLEEYTQCTNVQDENEILDLQGNSYNYDLVIISKANEHINYNIHPTQLGSSTCRPFMYNGYVDTRVRVQYEISGYQFYIRNIIISSGCLSTESPLVYTSTARPQ